MPRFALSFPHIEYDLNGTDRLLALRPGVHAEVVGLQPGPRCFFDTGAPLSVVSYRVGRLLPWTPIPVTNDPLPRFEAGVRNGSVPAIDLLSWEGIPATLGTVDVSLRSRRTGATAGPLTLRAKFLQSPSRHFNDLFVLLGMSFLADNAGSLQVTAGPFAAGGHLDLP